MSSSPLPSNTSRFEGCTLTGALSVTTSVRDSVSIVHGPKGCAHHNFSLLHATALEHDCIGVPAIQSSGLLESEIVFGGEAALERALAGAASSNPKCIFVLSTCIAETIGDDVGAVCGMHRGVPVIPVPTGGFLGGVFQNGVNNALCALSDMAVPCSADGTVNIIGEKNLEYEIEENYTEISRLLSALGLSLNIRFVHDLSPDDLPVLGRASLNILRDTSVRSVGNHLIARFGTPYLPAFPAGLRGTLQFLRQAAGICGVSSRTAIVEERSIQEAMLDDFSDLAGDHIALEGTALASSDINVPRDVAIALGMKVARNGCRVPLPLSPPVGTSGIRRMLHRWRRAIHA